MRPIHRCAAVVLTLSVLATVARAQEPPTKKLPTPEDTQKNMETFFSTIGPVQMRAAEASLELQTRYAERPEVAERIAAYKKNLFDSLKRRGFTADQALQITIATPLPSLH